MALATVKNKYQVVIPQHVRDVIGVSVGDVFEAKAIIDRGIAESIAEFKAGDSFGPFATHPEFLGPLHTGAKKTVARKPKR
jgi:bifunctional DNA-binding transcriptional regulator/antitoxin component of YhaV-PrlF toxin-antitoxin module